jgi:hypothetical protein
MAALSPWSIGRAKLRGGHTSILRMKKEEPDAPYELAEAA